MAKVDWDKVSKNYDKEIYSITRWEKKRERILQEFDKFQKSPKVLILGGGSEVYLQKDILSLFPNSKITLSDYSKGMLKISKKNFNHKNIKFVQEDMRKISYEDEFDIIISTNSILMPTIKENNLVFDLCHKALKKGGKLIAYLPSYESCVNLFEKQPENPFHLDHKEQVLADSVDGTKQSFHSNKTIDEVAKKFRSLSQKKVFCSESKEELEHLHGLYGETFPLHLNKQIFEWYVVLGK